MCDQYVERGDQDEETLIERDQREEEFSVATVYKPSVPLVMNCSYRPQGITVYCFIKK